MQLRSTLKKFKIYTKHDIFKQQNTFVVINGYWKRGEAYGANKKCPRVPRWHPTYFLFTHPKVNYQFHENMALVPNFALFS